MAARGDNGVCVCGCGHLQMVLPTYPVDIFVFCAHLGLIVENMGGN